MKMTLRLLRSTLSGQGLFCPFVYILQYLIIMQISSDVSDQIKQDWANSVDPGQTPQGLHNRHLSSYF